MKRFLTVALLLAASIAAYAQSTIRVNVPNLVAVDEQFNVTFVIDGEGQPQDFQWEPGDDFQLVWGPQKGRSSSVSFVNGKKTSSSQTTYTYVLMPRRTGTFQLKSATATMKGGSISSKAVSIQVVSNGAGSQGQSQGGTGSADRSSQQAQTGTVNGEDIFMRMSVSKTKAVVGETITATLKLYQRVNLAGFEDVKFPSFNGFWSQELQAPSNLEFHRESIGDNIYNAAVIRSWSLVPQQAGDLALEPAELVCLVNVRASSSSSNSIFDSFFQEDYRTIRKRVSTPSITVHVSKVPDGAPASFGGGVGDFSMKASLTRDSLKTHDAASLRITVSGKGNITLLEAPKVNFPPDFEVYDVKTTETSGSKTFEYPFIPRSRGNFTVGPVEYSYYNVSAGKYVTLRSEAMEICVSGSAQDAQGSASGSGQLVVNVDRRDVRDLGSDIRYISTASPKLSTKGSFLVGSALFWAILAVLAAAAAAVYFAFRGLAARRADVVGSRNRGATKMARKRLSQAGVFLQKDLSTAFYEELHKTLLGFVSDKLNMNAAEMSKENISAKLIEAGAGEALAAQFVALIDACEYARYAPSEGHDAMNAQFESAVNVISMIDQNMKHGHRSGAAAAIALLLMMPLAGHAQDSASLWAAGNQAYAEARYSDALDSWSSILASGEESAALYYNIGNACFKLGDNAHAIVNYERALKLDPSHADARFNLEHANSLLQDKIESVPEFFLKTWTRKMCWLVKSDTWAVLCMVLFALALAMLLLFLLGSASAARKTGFFTAIAALVLSVCCFIFANWQKKEGLAADTAVVTSPVAPAKSAPGSGTDLFVLHDGTKVKVLDRVGGWRNVQLSDGRQGWMDASDLETI